jgi:hypothetical protein
VGARRLDKFLKLVTVGCAVALGCLVQGLTPPAAAQPQSRPQALVQSGGVCTVGANASVSMHVIATHTGHDPSGVWSDWDLWHPFAPPSTTIWEGRVMTCRGIVIVSQIENRACSSPDTCPVRVMLVEGQVSRQLMDYEQVCTLHNTFMLSGDGRALMACDREFPLDVR